VAVDAVVYREKLVAARMVSAESALAAAREHAGGLQLHVTLRIGEQGLTVFTTDLLRDTGQRFVLQDALHPGGLYDRRRDRYRARCGRRACGHGDAPAGAQPQ